ncbi:MAG: HD domain-containing protein [Clostridia bacterium]|nr:HD domain-containing protein [Clostridia bacterium]
MNTTQVIEDAKKYIHELFAGNTDGHGADHTMRVYRNAMIIAESEAGANPEIVALAALLHDADDHKLFHTENNANARAFLAAQGTDPETADRICEAINAVSFSKNGGKQPETPEGRIVQDADRLDAIGAIGIARTFAFGGKHGRDFPSSIDHFHEKLLRLKDLMNTEKARELAKARHAFMEAFLREWEREIHERSGNMELHQYHDITKRGTVERLFYFTPDEDGMAIGKYANVYLPYGYSAEKAYPVLYVIHGGGGNPDAWLDCSKIKNALDVSFAEGRGMPFIAVFPTFYNHTPIRTGRVDEEAERGHVLRFQREIRNDLIPAVDAAYATRAEREARGIGGFSMGGVTTWFAFLENLDLFSVFLPLSGDCWQFGGLGGGKETAKTAQYLHDRVMEQGYGKDDFRIFAGTGYEDIACPNLTPQIEAMKGYPDVFEYSEDPGEGNLHYTLMKDAPHMYEKVYQHIYHDLPYLF